MSLTKAFPQPKGRGEDENKEGMDLRDYFAAAIMQGMCAKYGHATKDSMIMERAVEAYSMADAMMVARNYK